MKHDEETDAELQEFIDILSIFNLKLNEKPIRVSSDFTRGLGTEIELHLQELPYNVRYSFDVCLSHGFL